MLGRTAGLARFFFDPVALLLRLGRMGDAVVLHDSPPLVALFGAEHVRAVLSDAERFHNIDSAPFRVPPGSSLERLMRGITQMNGDAHRRCRRLMQPAFTKAALDGYAGVIAEVTEDFLRGWSVDRRVDLLAEMVVLTVRVAMRTLFGLDAAKDTATLADAALGVLSGVTDSRNVVLPFDLPLTPYRRLLRVSEEAESLLRAQVTARRRSSSTSKDALSRLLDDHDSGEGLSDDELIGQAMVLFAAGHETTAFTLAWTLMLLATHPEVAAKLAREVESELGASAPTPESIPRLTWLSAVVKESMRLLPATPSLFIRMTRGPFAVRGRDLPHDSWLLLSPLVEHRNAQVFPDPQRFSPERWATVQPKPWEYLPFGAGPRMCLGATFANQSIRIILPMLVQRFGVELLASRVDLKQQGITMGPSPGLEARVRPRGEWRSGRIDGRVRELVTLPD